MTRQFGRSARRDDGSTVFKMLTRTISTFGGAECTVLVTASLDEGFTHVSRSAAGFVDYDAIAEFTVVGSQNFVTPDHLRSLEEPFGSGVRATLVDAEYNEVYHRTHLAEVNLVVTRTRADDAGHVYYTENASYVWTISACPAGVPLDVHEIAETLKWDSEERGDFIPSSTAYLMAWALAQKTGGSN